MPRTTGVCHRSDGHLFPAITYPAASLSVTNERLRCSQHCTARYKPCAGNPQRVKIACAASSEPAVRFVPKTSLVLQPTTKTCPGFRCGSLNEFFSCCFDLFHYFFQRQHNHLASSNFVIFSVLQACRPPWKTSHAARYRRSSQHVRHPKLTRQGRGY